MPFLSDIPQIIFSPSADDIAVPAEGDVVLVTTITDASGTAVFCNTSTYSPGADGMVHLAELSELVNAAVMLSFSDADMLAAGCRHASCALSVAVSGGTTMQCRALYMWRDHTKRDMMFATQMRRRKVMEGAPQPVSVLTSGMTGLGVVVSAAYLSSDRTLWREVTVAVDCSDDYFTIAADTSSIREITSAPDGSTLYYYRLMLIDADGRQMDCIRIDVDSKTRPSVATHFVFRNMFGVPECVTFRGKNTEEQELDTDFGYAGREYVRLNAAVNESHKANTGWMTDEERRTVYDFMESPRAYVYDEGTLHRITITDIDSSVSRPADEPDNISLTWRYADGRLMRRPVVAPDTGGRPVFDQPPFDKTFG